MEEEKEFEKLRIEEEKKVEDEERVAQALTKEEKSKLESSIVLLNAREQEVEDKECFRGILLFFCNKMEESEKVFRVKSDVEPLSALSLSAVAFLKALVSFSDSDITYATGLFSRTAALTDVYSNAYKTKSSLVSRVFSFYSHSNPASNGEVRAAVIRAESLCLTGMMQLLQENIVGYVKAGLNLRRGYKELLTCWENLKNVGDPQTYDYHTVGGIYFSFGAVNVVLASLPGPILKLVSFFGFSCDRDLGFELLHKSFDAGGARAPLASLFLLGLYIILPSFVPAWSHKYLPKAEAVLTESLARCPNGALYLWLAGRMYRLKRDLDKSIKAFEESSVCYTGESFVQLKHLCFYDLGLSYFWKLNYEVALEYFEKLAMENYWSKAFYVFQWAVCAYMCGNKQKAIELFKTTPSFVVRKYGGRTISVEQYVIRKSKMFEILEYDLGSLPALELIYMWNGFSCMNKETLEKCLEMANEDLKRFNETLSPNAGKRNKKKGGSDNYFVDQKSMLLVIKSAILQNLGKERFDEAFDALAYVFEHENEIVEDTFIPPFAYYELGILHYLDDNVPDAKEAFAKAKEFKKYNFEFRLLFRLHLAGLELAPPKSKK